MVSMVCIDNSLSTAVLSMVCMVCISEQLGQRKTAHYCTRIDENLSSIHFATINNDMGHRPSALPKLITHYFNNSLLVIIEQGSGGVEGEGCGRRSTDSK